MCKMFSYYKSKNRDEKTFRKEEKMYNKKYQ